jgi:hypothetical protein
VSFPKARRLIGTYTRGKGRRVVQWLTRADGGSSGGQKVRGEGALNRLVARGAAGTALPGRSDRHGRSARATQSHAANGVQAHQARQA